MKSLTAAFRKEKPVGIAKMAIRKVAPTIASSRLLANLLFDLRIPSHACGALWDLTTLALLPVLDQHVCDGMRVLDMGTGNIAVLAAWVARRHRVQVVGVDISLDRLAFAQRTLFLNEISNVSLTCGDLFNGLQGYFDVICFNAPYVPSAWGEQYKLAGTTRDQDPRMRRTWDGGHDGLAVITRFLCDVPVVMTHDSLVLLGVNTLHVPDSAMVQVIESSRLRVQTTRRFLLNPSVAYVLVLK